MTVEVVVPGFGESISTVVLVEWLKKVGDQVKAGDDLVEVESDKATQKIASPSGGVIAKVLKNDGDSADVGEVIALIDESVASNAASAAPATPPSQSAPAPAAATEAAPRVMPAAARVMAENGVSTSQVTPTGPGGRILKIGRAHV